MADRFVSRNWNRNWNIEDHSQIAHIRECSDAARRNLRLGRWIRKLSPRQKLLVPDFHNIFNAAIILLLHQIVFVNLRTNDVSSIAFAKEVFEREAGFGDIYAKDCARILQDLSVLVTKLRELMFEGLSETNIPRGRSFIEGMPGPGEGIVSSLSAQGMGVIPQSQGVVRNLSAGAAAGGIGMPVQIAGGNAIYE